MGTTPDVRQHEYSQELAEEFDELKRLMDALSKLMEAGSHLEKAKNGTYGLMSPNLTMQIVQHQKADFSEAANKITTAIQQLEASMQDEQKLTDTVKEIGTAKHYSERNAMNYSKQHANKIGGLLPKLMKIDSDARTTAADTKLSVQQLKDKAKALDDELKPCVNEVNGIALQVRNLLTGLNRARGEIQKTTKGQNSKKRSWWNPFS